MPKMLFFAAKTVVRGQAEDDASFAKRIDHVAYMLRETARDALAGRHPKIVVHFSESRHEASIKCTVVW